MRFTSTIMLLGLFVVSLHIVGCGAWAKEAEKKPQPNQTKALMGNLLTHMDALKPFMVSDEKYTDKNNFIEIDGHLKELARLSKEAAHDPHLQLPGYRISAQVLQGHISETERVFRVGNKLYSRWMLNSTLSVCMSCHTQIPTVSRDLKKFESAEVYTNKFDQAEFLFATRAFEQSKGLFEDLIRRYPDNSMRSDQLETALERMIAYYARIKRDPGAAAQALRNYKKNEKIPEFLKNDIEAWITSFDKWAKEGTPELKTATEIVDFARKNLDVKASGYVITADNPRAALYLKVSGVLYEYLQTHPNTEVTPEILYWLAICDKGLTNNFFFSLGDVYLKECVVRFPHSATAKQCYDEYEQETLLSYSGSSGVHVPDDVKTELGRLKALIIAPPPQGGRH